MYIARRLKERNIAEYLLYMWQVEDILRACHLDIDELRRTYIDKFEATGEAEKELEEWYRGLIRMMKEEGVEEKGHLRMNRDIISRVAGLHDRLLASHGPTAYARAYYKVLPFIAELREKGERKDVSVVENCFDALYAIMLLRLRHKPISDGTAKAATDIARFLGLLAAEYKKERAGERASDRP